MSQPAPQVRLTLTEGVIEAVGGGLDTRPLRLFFRGALGAAPTGDGWRVPVRSYDGNDLIVRIARRLDKAGLSVEAQSATRST
jgi:hypothetical protein